MESVGLFAAKTKLSELVQDVEKGQEFVLTRHGKPAARLVPINKASTISIEDAVNELKKLREEIAFTREEVEALMREARATIEVCFFRSQSA